MHREGGNSDAAMGRQVGEQKRVCRLSYERLPLNFGLNLARRKRTTHTEKRGSRIYSLSCECVSCLSVHVSLWLPLATRRGLRILRVVEDRGICEQ